MKLKKNKGRKDCMVICYPIKQYNTVDILEKFRGFFDEYIPLNKKMPWGNKAISRTIKIVDKEDSSYIYFCIQFDELTYAQSIYIYSMLKYSDELPKHNINVTSYI